MEKSIRAYSLGELEELVTSAGLPKFRAMQIADWLYVKGVVSYDEMSNLPVSVREQMSSLYPIGSSCIEVKRESADGSRKYLIKLNDGEYVETVGIPSEDGRLTVCCSTQAGCSMGCTFCATAKEGLKRNLEAGEIVDQVLKVQNDFSKRVTNVVLMGQGEPFANYQAMSAALEIMNHKKLLNIGARHITVSTCGLIHGIEKFSQETEQYTLAISLHAARQEVRDAIMPGVRSQRLGSLRKAIQEYIDKTGRRVSLEYALMKGVNDSEEDLNALIQYGRRLLCHVNLIPLNEIEGSEYKPVSQQKMIEWRDALQDEGIAASIRRSRGSDIDGACGQLANKVVL